jgi:hypothetical protein
MLSGDVDDRACADGTLEMNVDLSLGNIVIFRVEVLHMPPPDEKKEKPVFYTKERRKDGRAREDRWARSGFLHCF